ncbi:SusD/RagB family nutrient-binding outer membrane lipoprotein [Dysgonomonas sp. Marseille-P4677]|uniref:RagB/SusD family nutrient uptake outer membrane protein n=1 Tax=Dysgonomonas sp. Marseille-P4677 TaxID=2364790 RepID=UPI0019116EDE|nr:RagB/SusD family nutrient uptake outer membrane protein [Dysgonomonas sp. Marseille-P4677]MBK5722742.1 SusD/RagB family nutrient-binding outer membrane lipoprotein [Dysgonomonas sp. Marseille-P4677]
MRYNIIYHIKHNICLVFLFCSAIFFSCTDDFERKNTNPDRLTDEDIKKDLLAVGGFIPTMQTDVIPTSDVGANEYQRAQNLTGDIFSGYMAAIGQWNGSSNNSTYNMDFSDWNDVGFNVAYRSVMSPWNQIRIKSQEYDVPYIYYLAQIIKIAGIHRITDNHGPIPYSQFGKGAMGAVYDSQEVVYESFFEELAEAVAELEKFISSNSNTGPLAKYDLVYNGNIRNWIKFANTLRLRLAIRVAYVNPTLAKKNAEEAVNNSYGVLTDNTDNASVKSGKGYTISHPLTVIWSSYKDIKMGASIESFLKGYNDPRLSKYFQPTASGEYNGVRNGVVISNKSRYEALSNPNVEAGAPIQWMCAAEAYFLRAEGAIRGWNMAGTDNLPSAKDLYNKGIEVSFAQYGVSSSYTSYINNEEALPARFSDVIASNSANPLSTITIKWNDSDSFEKKLERIITQKWLAMYPEGQEAWSEFRRTGYPKIFPVVTNNSSGKINTNIQIRRVPYPKSEYTSNRTNVTEAVNTLLGGADNGGTKVWWDKK